MGASLLWVWGCGGGVSAGLKGNVIAMDFPDESFDAVLDKATIDSILCGMQPRPELKKALNEVERCASSHHYHRAALWLAINNSKAAVPFVLKRLPPSSWAGSLLPGGG